MAVGMIATLAAMMACPSSSHAQPAAAAARSAQEYINLMQDVRAAEQRFAEIPSWNLIRLLAVNEGAREIDSKTRAYVIQIKQDLRNFQQHVAASRPEESHGESLEQHLASQRAAFHGLQAVSAAREEMNKYLLLSLECLSTPSQMCKPVLTGQRQRIAQISRYRARLLNNAHYLASNRVTRSYLETIFNTLQHEANLHAKLADRVIAYVRRYP